MTLSGDGTSGRIALPIRVQFHGGYNDSATVIVRVSKLSLRALPMALASHIIFGTYGFWLPNDPRGSWSDFVGSWELRRFGKPIRPDTAQSLARIDHDQRQRATAKLSLKFPPVQFSGVQAQAVGMGFGRAIDEGGYGLLACAILPEHVHTVIVEHSRRPGQIVGHLKGRATQNLMARNLWFADGRPVWGAKSWKVFLDTEDDVVRAIEYVRNNPMKEGKPPQRWSFVRTI